MSFIQRRYSAVKKQRGISLLEVLLSLSIIAIILIMATRYFFVANENKNVNQVRAQIGALLAATQLWKGSNPSYENLSLEQLISTGDFPSSANVKNNKLYDPWGDEIMLAPTGVSGFTITVTLPTATDCNKLLSSYPQGASGSGTARCASNAFTLTEGTAGT
ncbi:MAG: prepilin-type N-terminal cleavage/methylation domain-containing protein [Gammaproteobacteria bacterium]|nr:prepilin-type N-terminal cleavage/methylation domain-containing protein [Gammaproteobacteria bacterium]